MAAPWDKIKMAWLNGGVTYKQLAEKYHLSVKTIQNRASNEGWGKEKKTIREETGKQLRARVTRAKVNHLEKLIQANAQLIDGLLKITETISEEPVKNLFDKAGMLKNAESMAKAIQTAVETQRDLYRLPNMDQAFAKKKWSAEQKAKKAEQAISAGTVWKIDQPEGEESIDG